MPDMVAMKKALAAALILSAVMFAPPASEAVSVAAGSLATPSAGILFLDIPATFTFTNLSGGGASITQIVLSLASGLAFTQNPGFNVIANTDTGYSGWTGGSSSITLNFGGFAPLEVFSFAVDVDKGSNPNVSSFTGSTMQVTFGGSISPQSFIGSFSGLVASVSGSATPVAVPEPATLLLVSSALAAAGFVGRKRLIQLIRN